MRNFLIIMNLLHLVTALASCSSAPVHRTNPGLLRPGDLVFQRLNCGDLCEAIHRATKRPGFPAVSHVAVVESVQGRQITLIEAYDQGVARVTLDDLARRAHGTDGPAWIAARLKAPHDAVVPFFIQELRARLGRPYDPLFLPDNDAYYCSELISDALLSLGVRIFPRIAMSFGQPGTWEVGVWEKYYAERGREVPHGQPGTNPAQFLASPFLEILKNDGSLRDSP